MAEPLARELRAALLDVARESVRHGLEYRAPLAVGLSDFPPPLREVRATFVTLHIGAALRGCIGTVDAREPLVADVAFHAYAAAFRDPRFPPVRADEYDRLHYEVSVLSPREPMAATSYEELLHELRPGTDGLFLVAGPYRATFLPKVWESLPRPEQFVEQLQRKAGMPAGSWPAGCEAFRYTCEEFGTDGLGPA